MVDAALSIPPEVQLDAPVTLVITATNTHEKAVTLDSIDIEDSFLAGFQVVDIDPPPEETMHLPFVNQRSWTFSRMLAAGEACSVSFTLKPVVAGHFSGDVDVCNPNQDFTTLFADVVVKHGPEAPNPEP